MPEAAPSRTVPDSIGPVLEGVRVIEMAGLGPAPFCAMLLADMGADVVRIDRVVQAGHTDPDPRFDVTARSRRSVAIDLKRAEAAEIVLRLVARADVLLEGFRPGVMERLGLGPAECHMRNPRLVYGRMSGWGQTGPYSQLAGHDITYLAVTGALHAIGRAGGPPAVPLNLVGDFGGGGAYLAIGVLGALIAARAIGLSQVVDASIVDGVGSLLSMTRGRIADGSWVDERGTNRLDSGAPWYDVYLCADGGYVAIGAVEDKFWQALLRGLGVAEDPDFQVDRQDRATWDGLRRRLAEIFARRPREDWVHALAGLDACLAPVLSLEESLSDPHLVQRNAFVDIEGVQHPAPAPRFSASGERIPQRPPASGEHTITVLRDAGIPDELIMPLLARGVIQQS